MLLSYALINDVNQRYQSAREIKCDIDDIFEHTGRETCHDRLTTRENYFDDRSLLCPVILDKDGHCFTEASGQDLCLK